MRQNFESLEYFKQLHSIADRHTGQKLKLVHCGNGVQCTCNEFKKYLVHHCIQNRPTVQHSPYQNGVAERMNRTLVKLVRAMLLCKSVLTRL